VLLKKLGKDFMIKQDSENNTRNKKILLMGLDNGGKSSILLSLTRDIDLSHYFPKPTMGIEIINHTIDNTTFHIWDFSGQKQFRDQHLKDLDKNIGGTDKIIYIIDVQDIDRYDLALQYLKKIVTYVIEHNLDIEFSVFIHKWDPSIEKKEHFDEKLVQTKLIDKIDDIFSDYPSKLFKTSIYTVFRKQIVF
jgi:small GTP-binding protein